jgi:glucosyl-3-phosphoglycerate synthase
VTTADPVRIVLPVLPATDAAGALPIAIALAGQRGRVVLLAVVEVPQGRDLAGATSAARAARRQLRALAHLVPDGVAHETVLRAADSIVSGIAQVASEAECLLLVPLPDEGAERALESDPYRRLVIAPPADAAFIRLGKNRSVRSLLVSARGGPHAELALSVAQRIARAEGAAITVMHVDVPQSSPAERQQEQRLFQSLVASSADAPRLRTSSVPADSPESAVTDETRRHDVVVMGARVTTNSGEGGIGDVPRAVLEGSDATVIVVKPRRPVNPLIFRPRPAQVDQVVNAWFVENTTHCREYANLEELLVEKRRRGLTLGVALIAGAATDTLPAHARVLIEELSRDLPLLDEVALFTPADPEILAAAEAAGLRPVPVPEASSGRRGHLLRSGLRELATDIVVWIDADIRNAHAKLVYGLAGPLILDERYLYVKGFHQLPPEAPEADLQSLVGEFAARPLLNLFYAELSGVIDPLCTDHAIRRAVGTGIATFSGGAAELGILLDVFARHGLATIAQVALDERIARPLTMREANRRAFSAAQILSQRLGLPEGHHLRDRASPTMKLIQQDGDRFSIDLFDARESELML